jgi:hypothetical protein
MEPEEFISRKKIEKSMAPKIGHEYFVDASKLGIGSDDKTLPCVLESHSGGKCDVRLADGPYTGMRVTVDNKNITAVDKKDINHICGDLFK